jgi:uncharacterized membrane protein (DUF2068 family)
MTMVSPAAPARPGHAVGLRLVAVFEAAKGLLVLLGGSGLLLLVNRDAQAIAERMIEHLHLNPASRYPRIFVHIASQATSARLHWLAFGALIYSILRLSEAVGLWSGRRWAEWLGVVSGLLYVPFEVRAMIHRPGPEPAVALVINFGVVFYLAGQLREAPAAGAGHSSGTPSAI